MSENVVMGAARRIRDGSVLDLMKASLLAPLKDERRDYRWDFSLE